MAASIGASSSSKSAANGTPTKPTPCRLADKPYITKLGSGDMNTAPGTAQARLSKLINSSEPLPSISAQPSGSLACAASAAFRSSQRSAG